VKTIRMHDQYQIYEYGLDAPESKEFAEGFKPDLSPQQMLELGVFGGAYFEGEHDEFPASWFNEAKLAHAYDKSLNYFAVKASQPREEWLRKGWINEQDPRGWFQWYCRYYLGRRSDDDARQIKRWKNMKRHVSQVMNACRPGDELCRPVQRQALLHWTYDSRKL